MIRNVIFELVGVIFIHSPFRGNTFPGGTTGEIERMILKSTDEAEDLKSIDNSQMMIQTFSIDYRNYSDSVVSLSWCRQQSI